MYLKGIYNGRSASFILFILLLFVLVGLILSNGLAFLIYGKSNIFENADQLRLFQFISSLFTFLLPSIATAYLCSNNPSEYLFIRKVPSIKIFGLALISMILLSPSITLVGMINKKMELPSFMEPVEQWMQALEGSAADMTTFLLSQSDLLSLVSNLIVVAITAAIAEEFFFRGIMYRIIAKWFVNHHIVIWLSAFIFSAVHMQFYGFLPRLMLGAYFGYLLYWSKSIWLPVFTHFINNAVAVIGLSNASLKENEYITGDIPESDLIPYIIMAASFLIFFFFCMNNLRKKLHGNP